MSYFFYTLYNVVGHCVSAVRCETTPSLFEAFRGSSYDPGMTAIKALLPMLNICKYFLLVLQKHSMRNVQLQLSKAVILVATIYFDCTWFLFEMCENVSLHSPSASVTPVPESLSASLLLNEHDRHSPRHPVSVGTAEELKTQKSGSSIFGSTMGFSV